MRVRRMVNGSVDRRISASRLSLAVICTGPRVSPSPGISVTTSHNAPESRKFIRARPQTAGAIST